MAGIPGKEVLEKRIKSVVDAKENVKPPPRIQKVICVLRDHKNFPKNYEPRMVSFGPIHHGKEKYKLGEKYKLVMTNEFVKGSEEKINDLYKKVGEKIKELRDCFELEEEVNKKFKDEDLAWLLLVDGCAILQYIYCAESEDKKFEELNIKPDIKSFIQQDLFLLENQLPYRLLKWLMSWSENGTNLEKLIGAYIDEHVAPRPTEEQLSIFLKACPSSLSWYLPQILKIQKSGSKKQESHQSKDTQQEQRISIDGDEIPIHLLDFLRRRLLYMSEETNGEKSKRRTWQCCRNDHELRADMPEETNGGQNWQSYRNVHELQAAGIQVERSKEKNSLLSNISFTTLGCLGYLWLPPITVDDSTGPMFLNLIAYEMCPDFPNDFGITSYISFLDSLIDEANDVKMLRKAGILHNCLGSDEEVAQVFNEISTDLVPDSKIYGDIKLQIEKHYKNIFMTWLAQFCHEHFSSPWTFMAFVGALLALVLTFIQTKYTVNSPPGPCDNFCKNFT